ncbi:RHS repeat-associated core domain-containing protein, partial [Lelliottia sp. V104_15]
AETGLYYNRHRYYDPRQGRYITQDPIGLAGGWNGYTYPLNPVTDFDPLGLWVFAIPAIGWGISEIVAFLGGAAAGGAMLATPSDSQQVKEKNDNLTNCRTTPPDPCGPDGELLRKVRNAKDNLGKYAKGTASCKSGMSSYQLNQRKNDWLALAEARSHRDSVCYGGGDEGHLAPQATAWEKVSACANLLK